jgi:alpha-galactosidase
VFELVYEGLVVSSSVPFEAELGRRALALITEDFSTTAESISASSEQGLTLNWQANQIGSGPVWEFELTAENKGGSPLALTRLDSAALKLEGGPWRVESFASAWGDEFRPLSGTTRHDTFLDVRSGRSSHGKSPVAYLVRESDGFTVVVAPAWSGNWHIDIFAGGWIRAGISTWNFEVLLAPGAGLTAPSVVIAAAPTKELAQRFLQEAIRDNWMARTALTDKIPVEWNHWWPYEDVEVNESVIHENLELAKLMPVDAIVVDAGWFGESSLDTNWTDLRGDWESVNLARFPSGLAELGKRITAAGLQPGIWMEIEAVGAKSNLRKNLQEAMARDDSGGRPDPSYRVGTVSLDQDDPGFLGYVCLGSEAGWQHCYDSISNVVGTMGAAWLKVDFNIDPGSGCTRTDHGHSAGDGLFWHYQGLYRLLDEIRAAFPKLLIEACSSGGLRIDLGLAKHVHAFFLSDPDYTEHHLQVLWGAAHLIPPVAILHWPWSWWRNGYEPSQLDWDTVDVETFDVMVRSAMLHRLGVSYPLPLMPEKLKVRLNHHLEIYRASIAPLLPTATLQPLTNSPTRAGDGVRVPAWQLCSEVGTSGEVHLVMALALEANAQSEHFTVGQIDPNAEYFVVDLETGKSLELKGEQISSQVLIELVGNARSWICELRRKKVIP